MWGGLGWGRPGRRLNRARRITAEGTVRRGRSCSEEEGLAELPGGAGRATPLPGRHLREARSHGGRLPTGWGRAPRPRSGGERALRPPSGPEDALPRAVVDRGLRALPPVRPTPSRCLVALCPPPHPATSMLALAPDTRTFAFGLHGSTPSVVLPHPISSPLPWAWTEKSQVRAVLLGW